MRTRGDNKQCHNKPLHLELDPAAVSAGTESLPAPVVTRLGRYKARRRYARRLRTRLLGALIGTFLVTGANGDPVEADAERLKLTAILNVFAERTGTRFILDPRVNAKVTLIGTNVESLTAKDVSRILFLYGYEAYVSGDIVYVMPNALPESVKSEFGSRWP